MGFAGRLKRVLLRWIDPFGEYPRRKEERRLLGDRRRAAQRLKALYVAADRGEDVAAEIVVAEAEVEDLTARLPRGSTDAFVVTALMSAWMALFLNGIGEVFRDAVRTGWGSLDNPHHLEYMYLTSRLCIVGQWFASPVVCVTIFAATLSMLWCVQRRLQRRHARLILGAATLAIFAATMTVVFAQMQLIMFPMLPLG